MPIPVKEVSVSRIPLNLPLEDDPAQEEYVSVRVATVRENSERSQLGTRQRRFFEEDPETGKRTEMVQYDFVYAEQKMLETFLTLADCSIQRTDMLTEKLAPLFRFSKGPDGKMRISMTWDEFKEAWGILPQSWADAIHEKVLLVNKEWNPNFRR